MCENEYIGYMKINTYPGFSESYRIIAKKDFEVLGHKIKKDQIGGLIKSPIQIYDTDKLFWIDSTVFINGSSHIEGSYISNDNEISLTLTNVSIHNSELFTHENYSNSIYNSTISDSKININSCIIKGSSIRSTNIISNYAVILRNTKIINSSIIPNNLIKLIGSEVTNGFITDTNDVINIGPIGSGDNIISFYFDKNMQLVAKCGYFCDSIDKFEEAVIKEYRDNKYAKQYLATIEYVKIIMGINKEN